MIQTDPQYKFLYIAMEHYVGTMNQRMDKVTGPAVFSSQTINYRKPITRAFGRWSNIPESAYVNLSVCLHACTNERTYSHAYVVKLLIRKSEFETIIKVL